MPIYLMLSNLTDEGKKVVEEKPRRIKEINKEVEKMGVKILSRYALWGAYDFLNILEASDNQTKPQTNKVEEVQPWKKPRKVIMKIYTNWQRH